LMEPRLGKLMAARKALDSALQLALHLELL